MLNTGLWVIIGLFCDVSTFFSRCPDVVKCPAVAARLCGDRTLNYSSLDSMKVTDSDSNNSITSVVHVACALYSSEFI